MDACRISMGFESVWNLSSIGIIVLSLCLTRWWWTRDGRESLVRAMLSRQAITGTTNRVGDANGRRSKWTTGSAAHLVNLYVWCHNSTPPRTTKLPAIRLRFISVHGNIFASMMKSNSILALKKVEQQFSTAPPPGTSRAAAAIVRSSAHTTIDNQ